MLHREKNQLDFSDRSILKQLQENARKPYRKIAEDLGLSNSFVHQRIRKMESMGVVQGHAAKINGKALGLSTLAYTGITLKEARFSRSIMEALKELPEVESGHYISGKYAILCKIRCRDNEHLHEILYTHIHGIEGVGGTDSFIVFSEGFEKPVFVGE